jgi:hypothetical protein
VAERLFLHLGTPKSGTTFLQSVWWANRGGLLAQGLLLPGAGVREHYWASCAVRGPQQLRHIPPEGIGAWERVLDAAGSHDGDVLISHELFSPAPDDRVDPAMERLAAVADEVHLLLTARDLVRQIPAEWQQRTKHGRSQTYADFLGMIQRDESVNFWRVQDVAGVLDRWGQGLPPGRVHLVVQPPPGGPRSFLWDRTCEVLGVDGTGMAERATRSNESLGLVQVETLRRLAAELDEGEGLPKSTQRLLKDFVAETILRDQEGEKIVVPPEAYPWVVERAAEMVEQLGTRGYHVVGDLAHLVPSPEPVPGRSPSEVDDSEISASALGALAEFVRHEEARRRRERQAVAASRVTRVRRRLGRVRRAVRRRVGR